MIISIILAHPNKNSFNHAIASTTKKVAIRNGHKVIFHDLYKEKFNCVLPSQEIPKDGKVNQKIQEYCNEIAQSDGIIIIHPNWWGQPPAILKGWIDRVIRPGVAYEFKETDSGEGIPVGLLKAKMAIVFNTSNTFSVREKKVFGDPLDRIWKDCIFGLCGVNNFFRKTYGVIVISSLKQRQQWLNDVTKIINKYFPEN